MTDQQALIALNGVAGLGAVTVGRLIESLGSAAAILDADVQALAAVRWMGPERASQVRRELDKADWRREVDRAESLGVNLVTWADPQYPSHLRRIFDPPMVLYVSGEVTALAAPAIAVVGTRHPTVYGREMARQLAYRLASAGYVIVSGLALGIDTEAHRGALKAGGRTTAVLGGALDCLFPRENADLAAEMARSGGAVATEYPFGRQPDRQTFPMRNRIVSGLATGVLVVEAPLASGTMITVDQALEQGRTVMAVPGRADSTASQGCHKLIRSGARLVTTADEVLEELQELLPVPHTQPPATATRTPLQAAQPALPPLTADEQKIVDALGDEETLADALVRATGLAAGSLNGLLVGLQIKRRVRLLPGGLVKKI